MKKSVRLFGIIIFVLVILSFRGGVVKASNEEYTYKELSEGNIEIESYMGNDKEVVIPDEICGKKVVSLGEYSFCWSDIEKVTLNESLVKISRNTFSSLSNLKEVIFNKNLKEIDENSFADCKSLTSVNIPQGVKKIGESAFNKCTSLENVNLSCSIKTIEKNTFFGCISLRDITMSDDITDIGESVFYGCKKLESICLPENLKTIGESCFSGCSSLKSITIPRGVTGIGKNALKGVADDFKIHNNSIVEITDDIYPSEDITNKYVSLSLKYNSGGSAELRCGDDIIKEAASVKVGSKVKINISSDIGNIYKVKVNGYYIPKPYEFTVGNLDYNVEVEFKKCRAHDYCDDNIVYKKATCTSIGTVTKKCIYCSLPVTQKNSEALGHSYGGYVTDKKSTYKSYGEKSRHCSRCNSRINITKIPKLIYVSKVKPKAGSKRLEVGNRYKMSISVSPSSAYNKTFRYVSSSKVCSVSSAGVVSGKRAGSCSVSVIAKDGSGKKGTVKIKVYPKKIAKVKLKSTKKKAKISYGKSLGASKYEIYRSTKKRSGYKRIKVTRNRSYVDKGVKGRRVYYYKVRGVSGKYKSSFSRVVRVRVK